MWQLASRRGSYAAAGHASAAMRSASLRAATVQTTSYIAGLHRAAAVAACTAAVPCAAAAAASPRRTFSSEAAATAAAGIYTQKIPKKKGTFRDRVRVHVSGGRGGNGCSSYDTDPYGRGGPDGANGGRGGDVYLVSTSQLSVFGSDSFHLRGQKGHSGGSKLSKGRNGYSLKVPIPAGTVVSEILATDPTKAEYTLKFLADMDREGLELKVATGGIGGLGNRAFKTKYRKQARFSTVGRFGTARWLYLELKCIADVGLVGYPNAGKSSFLAAISNATPEIANYPFTTLHPQVGIVELGNTLAGDEKASSTPDIDGIGAVGTPSFASSASTTMRRMSVADLPGLISGAASENRGLGHEFLKHIQRTRVLCYVIDISGNDDRDPVQDFLSLQQELQHFDPSLLLKPSIIIANKIDNTSKQRRSWMTSKINELATVTELPIFSASCLKSTGLHEVVSELATRVAQQAEAEREERVRNMTLEVERERIVQDELDQQASEIERENAEVRRLQSADPRAADIVEDERDAQTQYEEDEDEEDAQQESPVKPPTRSAASSSPPKSKKAAAAPKTKKKKAGKN